MAFTVTAAINLRSTRTGLAATLRAQLYDSAGTTSGSAVASGFSELGGGSYQFTHAYPDGFQGSVMIYDAGAPSVRLAGFAVNPFAAGAGGGLTTQQAADLAAARAGVDLLKSLQKLATVAATSTTTSVVGDGSLDATAGTYATSSAGSCWMVFTSGANQGQARPIASYGGGNRTFGFSQAWPVAPSVGDTFAVYARYK